jgi:hypothetical protein
MREHLQANRPNRHTPRLGHRRRDDYTFSDLIAVTGSSDGNVNGAGDGEHGGSNAGDNGRNGDLAVPSVPPSEALDRAPRRTIAFYPLQHRVRLGASSAKTVGRGKEFTARIVAYPENMEQQVQAQLASPAPHATQHMGLESCLWRTARE